MKLLEQVRQVARLRHFAFSTEECYLHWIERYLRFHRTAEGFQHPRMLGATHLEAGLTWLVKTVAACSNSCLFHAWTNLT